MSSAALIYSLIGLGDTPTKFAFGELKHRCCSIMNNLAPPSCNYPPAFSFIWKGSGSSAMYGFWKHWLNDRQSTYVRMSPENSYRVAEYGRSYNQLVSVILLQEICPAEGIDDDIYDFANTNKIENLEKIDEISLESGDDVSGLLNLDSFISTPPLCCEPQSYNGDFPSASMQMKAERIRKSCTLEYSPEGIEKILELDIAPDWFKTVDQEPLFYQLLSKGDMAGAWMCLNSNGWRLKDATKAIKALAEKSSDDNFREFAELWSSCERDSSYEY
ncbi:hypothetical protein [Microbulbifer sp. TRSA007]|uniref:hypothetical protein n=1 Tax=Microbulbifer sp. TRSA007 TaxID=3243384 RepID=UPI0040395042